MHVSIEDEAGPDVPTHKLLLLEVEPTSNKMIRFYNTMAHSLVEKWLTGKRILPNIHVQLCLESKDQQLRVILCRAGTRRP